MEEKADHISSLELQGVIGFNGAVASGLLLHPMDEHILYPLGSTIVVRHLTENTQTFLKGHDHDVSCMALSSTGKYLASGQVTHMGFNAPVIIWDLETYEKVHTLELHKGKVQDLGFSPDGKFLATLGGRDDNKLVIWNVETGTSVCGATASSETALTLKWFNNSSNMLVTGGCQNLRVWSFDEKNRKIRPSDCRLGNIRRVFLSILVDDQDEMMYCGAETGDVVKVSLKNESYLFKRSGPQNAFSMGVQTLVKQSDGDIVVGAGDGTVAVMDPETLKVKRTQKFAGAITSLALNANQDHVFVGTSKCNIYLAHVATMEWECRNTCHFARINDVAFPQGYSELFATCSKNDIRVWHSKTRNELLRINVPNLECLCIVFEPNGKSIISGWSDGKIRAFRPQTGRLMYAINDAHRDGVTALACFYNPKLQNGLRIVSGGQAGTVRVWSIGAQSQTMVVSMKEHKDKVNNICINDDGTECVTASADGSCIVWSLTRFVRNQCLFASTKFKSVLYHPDQSQILTAGSDRKLTYWDAMKNGGDAIRIVEGSSSGTINCLDVTERGEAFISAGADKVLKLWGYDEAHNYAQGIGHSGAITKCRISPNQDFIVTVGDEGAIFIWTMPELEIEAAAD